MGKHKPNHNNRERLAPKRSRPTTSSNTDTETDTDSDDVQKSTHEQSWPRFIVLESLDEQRPLSKLSPFAVEKGIKSIAGESIKVKKLVSGNLLLECGTRSHAENLLRCTKFIEIPIRSSPHRTLNISKGVVRSRDLEGTDEAEMIANLGSQGVIAARRVTVRRDGVQVQTNTYILTFNTPVVPITIKAGFVQLSVSPFIPNPLRCFNCQRFGHHRDRCKRQATCPRCGKEGHDDPNCSSEVKCVNCNGNHFAYSKVCPRWVHEKEIQTVRVRDNITFPEARKIVDGRINTSVAGQTYSHVVKSNVKPQTRSICVQTDVTWPNGADSFQSISQSVNHSLPSKSVTTSSVQTTVSETTKQNKETTKPETSKQNNNNKQSNRTKKGTDDPIKLHNRFGSMDGMDTEEPPPSPTGSKSPKKFTPILPPS